MQSQFMRRALELSKKGYGFVNPNPIVGAVIVHNGIVIGEGYHQKFGENHAEVNAIEDAISKGNSEKLSHSELYVTLEPCCHWGKTPPCTDAILKSGIKNVYIGCEDPNPKVHGGGINILRNNGVKVTSGILHEEIKKSNEIFFHWQEEKAPLVTMKSASSLDGKIATCTGESKWITSQESRIEVHRMRSRVAAVLVGVNTVIADNPRLDVRLDGVFHNPIRIVLDSNGRTPVESAVLKYNDSKTIMVMKKGISEEIKKRYLHRGAKVIEVPLKDGKLELKYLIEVLGKMEIDSVLIEGGGEIHFSALSEGIVDRVSMFIAPMIIGGIESKSSVGGNGFYSIEDAVKLEKYTIKPIGKDFLLQGRVRRVKELCSQE